MAIVSNTFLTYSAKGIREDLSNIITNIAPEETPYMSNIGRENVSNSLFEWQTDTLASAAANAQLEGDDVASFDSVTATTGLGYLYETGDGLIGYADAERRSTNYGTIFYIGNNIQQFVYIFLYKHYEYQLMMFCNVLQLHLKYRIL